MPGGDRTGPMGMGPRTGRAAGFCAGYDVPGYANPAYGRGGGMGWGRGRGFGGGFGRGFGGRGFGGRGWGWRNRHWATGVPGRQYYDYGPARADYASSESVSEADALRQHAATLQAELDSINQRLKQMEEEKAG